MTRRPRGPQRLRAALTLAVLLVTSSASAQSLPPPQRSDAWQTVSTVSMLVGMTSQVVMPRIYYSDVEVTVGWKARWHVSVLAPTLTLVSLAALNEYGIKPEITSYRPGCGPSNVGVAGCTTFGMPSTHTFVAFSALGHGTGVFLVDSLKWSDGRFNAGAIAGDVVLPLIASALTYAGRVSGTPSQEHGDQALVGAGLGLVSGVVLGGAYALFQRAECGYGSGIICW